ncbi:MAG: hypothetical protein NZT61_05725 [Deltaproteobacteria bacterium]|nr:hypothetical protein [Deltaproteobacteria bacterium]
MRIVKGKARVGSKAEKAFLVYFLEKVRLEYVNFVSRFRDKGLEEVSLCCSKIFFSRRPRRSLKSIHQSVGQWTFNFRSIFYSQFGLNRFF